MVAFGNYLGLPGSASGPQVKQALLDFMIGVVRDYERSQAMTSAAAAVSPITPS